MFVFVFLKAFQQRNVNGLHYLPVIPTSWCMVATEFYVIAVVASRGWDLPFVFAVGTCAGSGAILAMYIHSRLFKES